MFKLVKTYYGDKSEEFKRVQIQICNVSNLRAVKMMGKGTKRRQEQAYQTLTGCLTLAEGNEQAQAMTFNNLACYYRRIGNFHTSL